jgi:hypothetical protein
MASLSRRNVIGTNHRCCSLLVRLRPRHQVRFLSFFPTNGKNKGPAGIKHGGALGAD